MGSNHGPDRLHRDSKAMVSRRELKQAEESKWAFDKQIHRTVVIRRNNDVSQLGG